MPIVADYCHYRCGCRRDSARPRTPAAVGQSPPVSRDANGQYRRLSPPLPGEQIEANGRGRRSEYITVAAHEGAPWLFLAQVDTVVATNDAVTDLTVASIGGRRLEDVRVEDG